jgi:hypothetical protein
VAAFFLNRDADETLQIVTAVTDCLGGCGTVHKFREEVALNGDPVALRPTWKSNLGWLLLVVVIVIAVAS